MNQSTDPSGVPTSPVADHALATVADRRLSPQLYLIPLLVVSFLAVAWLVFSWSLQADDDPQALVRDMRTPNHGSWQKAYALAELLRNPRNEALKENTALCRELASILNEQLRNVNNDPSRTRFRVFLCRALGEFHVPDGLPFLLQAADASRSKGQVDVPCAALEALALLAGNIGPDVLRGDPRAMALLLDASHAASDPGATVNTNRVASTAAFTLGVVGGPVATRRLRELLEDSRPDVRYNAATGLARHGDTAAVPVLLEMLDTDKQLSLNDEPDAAAHARNRALVQSNAVRAAVRLVAASPQADRHVLIDALEQLRDAPELSSRLRASVQAAQAELREQNGRSSN
jgi:hypothetical protein